MPNLLYDDIFKNFMKNPKSRWYLTMLISEIIEKDYEYVSENMQVLDSELFKYKSQEKGRTCDLLINVGKYVIDIEMNKYYDKNLFVNKIRYLHHIYNINFPRRSDEPKKIVIQVHINNYKNEINEEEIMYKNQKNKIMSEYEKIKIYSLVNIEEKWDNQEELSKLEKLLLIIKLSEKPKKLEEFIRSDKEMTEMEKSKKLLEYIGDSLDKAFDYEEEKRREQRSIIASAKELGLKEGKDIGLKEGKDIGLKEGKNIGLKEGLKEVAKNMLKNNIDIESINTYTNLSIKEITELKKSI